MNMRTKALILAATFVVAGVASTMAQVYSANAVGYVNVTIPADGSAILANPFNTSPSNHLNTILPLGDAGVDTIVFRFKTDVQNFGEAITYYAGFGWYSEDLDADCDVGCTGPYMMINPGEGFFIFNPNQTPLNVTFVGELPQGALVNEIQGTNKLSLLASQVPQALPLGSAGMANTLEFPAGVDDVVFIFDSDVQAYKEAYTYYDGFGWFSNNEDDPGPLGPTIPVATGFFVQKVGATVNWTRNFSVN